jgi:hypothetical protein
VNIRFNPAGLVSMLAILAATATAGAAARAADVYALTPAQKAQALHAAEGTDERIVDGDGGPSIHGEFGALIGTGGTRSVYGTAAIPIGESGGAIVSFENSRFGQVRRR